MKSIFFKEFTHNWEDKAQRPIEEMDDSLELMFDAQRSLMVACGVQNVAPDIAFVISANALAAEVAETSEFFTDATKPWKRSLVVDIDAIKEEIVDQMHFVMQQALIAGMDWEEFYEMYMRKNARNWQRIQEKLRLSEDV